MIMKHFISAFLLTVALISGAHAGTKCMSGRQDFHVVVLNTDRTQSRSTSIGMSAKGLFFKAVRRTISPSSEFSHTYSCFPSGASVSVFIDSKNDGEFERCFCPPGVQNIRAFVDSGRTVCECSAQGK